MTAFVLLLSHNYVTTATADTSIPWINSVHWQKKITAVAVTADVQYSP